MPEMCQNLLRLTPFVGCREASWGSETMSMSADFATATEEFLHILHLSDLHFTIESKVPVLLQPLIDDLRYELGLKKLDYLVVSGDFTDKCRIGTPEVVEVVNHFLRDLMAAFLLTPEQVIIVPGNHDCNCDHDEFFDVKKEGEGQVYPDTAFKEYGYVNLRKDNYRDRFKGFADFYNNFYQGQRTYTLDPERQFDLFRFEDTGLTFLGLNSAWQIDCFNMKKASLNESAVGCALLEGKPRGLGIVVVHHAINTDARRSEWGMISRMGLAGYRILLHGDVHETRDWIWDHQDPKQAMYIFGAGTFGARASDRGESTPRMYTLLKVNRSLSELVVVRRKQNSPQDQFEGHYVRGHNSYTYSLKTDKNLKPSRPRTKQKASNLPYQRLSKYCRAEAEKNANISLPLIAPNGIPVVGSISGLFVDLPLLIEHEHGLPATVIRNPGNSTTEDLRNRHTTFVSSASREAVTARSLRPCTIADRLKPGARQLIGGDPGSGKSTLLQRLAYNYALSFPRNSDPIQASGNAHQLPAYSWLPVLIRCEDLAKQEISAKFSDVLIGHLERQEFSSTIELASDIDQLLEEGRVILLCDGLDEIPSREGRVQFCSILSTISYRFPEVPIIITSRVIGIEHVRKTLTPRFDYLVVNRLDPTTKKLLIQGWSNYIGMGAGELATLIERVCYGEAIAKFTDIILMLALVVQIQSLDHKLPVRHIDIYRRAVELMVERGMRPSGALLTASEVIPHLEVLAYRMREGGQQRCLDKEIVKTFKELRDREPDETVLRTRTCEELLSALIESMGMLNIAGNKTDRGIDRSVIQFFHQSFQEYFAALAIRDGRSGKGQDDPLYSLGKIFTQFQVLEQKVVIAGLYKTAEWVLAGNWQETVRMTIALLAPELADDAIRLVLADSLENPREARPRAIFAFYCLFYEPIVSEAVEAEVFSALIACANEDDGFGTGVNTSMDEAVAACAGFQVYERFKVWLLQRFIGVKNRKRFTIARLLLTRLDFESLIITTESAEPIVTYAEQGLHATQQLDRVRTALELVNRFYASRGKLPLLTSDQRAKIAETLISALSEDEATETAAIWALRWLTDADSRTPTEENHISLSVEQIGRIEERLRRKALDSLSLGRGCLVLNSQAGLKIVNGQQDWIMELAKIADGAKPRRDLVPVLSTGREAESLGWMKELLYRDFDFRDLPLVARALGAFGVYVPEMAAPLRSTFASEREHINLRDEAFLYLALIGTSDVIKAFIEAADTEPIDEDDYVYSRGLFGLLFVDDVDVLYRQIRKNLPHSDINAYAFGLGGSRDPRGAVLLKQLENDPNEKIRKAVRKVSQCSWMSV